jgi:hypothetical protein
MQVEDGAGGVIDYETEEGVQEAIFNEVHWKRYNLAEEAPICQGKKNCVLNYCILLLICGRHVHLSFALKYSKGLGLEHFALHSFLLGTWLSRTQGH